MISLIMEFDCKDCPYADIEIVHQQKYPFCASKPEDFFWTARCKHENACRRMEEIMFDRKLKQDVRKGRGDGDG